MDVSCPTIQVSEKNGYFCNIAHLIAISCSRLVHLWKMDNTTKVKVSDG